ncbi:hypothetical protein B6S59_22360 [Pseudomonas sp. A46]|nr:hypothetical protein [Pseudomonas sp. A46]OWJ91845.1 hypothetical protein B6S59_22360 [Pseudomonas sp. A46]
MADISMSEDFKATFAGACSAYVTDGVSLPSITQLPGQAKPVASRGKAATIGPVFYEGDGKAISRVVPGCLTTGIGTMNSLKDMRGAVNR